MSQSGSSPRRHGRPSMQDRRLSIIQDTAVDDLHDIDTHAFDDKSPSPHHESSVKSYMESHSPNDENSHKCSPRSPLMGRDESVVDEGKVEMVLEVRREEGNVPRGRKADWVMTPLEPAANTSHNEPEAKDANTTRTSPMDDWKEMFPAIPPN